MTDFPYLMSRVVGTPLLIAKPKLDVILDVMHRKLSGQAMQSPQQSLHHGGFSFAEGGVAIIPVMGTLVRRSTFMSAESGLTSYHHIETMAEDAFADSAVNAVLLELDSCGGEAGGVFDLAEKLRRLARSSRKPLWAVADEAALSAAYAIASAADQIWLTRTAEVGSIGVVAVHTDQSAADKKMGLSYSFIHAGRHKIDANPHEPLPDSVRDSIQQDVDALHHQFAALVAGHRNLSPGEVLGTEAAVYRGQAAITAGLADHIGTLAEALDALRAHESPKSQKEKTMTHMESEPAVMATEPTSSPSMATPTIQEHTVDMSQIEAQIESRLRAQMSELAEIAAQAKRMGVNVDPAEAMAKGVTPDALRKSVLEQAVARDTQEDIAAHIPAPSQPKTSALVDAAARVAGSK
jgi:signal peptide peptidase SppA